MKRKEQLFVPLGDEEKAAIKAAAIACHMPLATWARGALMREATKQRPIDRSDAS
jgi:hypothetical protein